ncbi:MAG: amidohydrolase family protein [Myxococcota bacterium]|nr:amidohydrolase family protein [Myxococcota bacterium]
MRAPDDDPRPSRVRTGTLGALVAAVAIAIAIAWRIPTLSTGSPPPSRWRDSDIPRIDVHVHVPPSQASRALRLFREHGDVYLALNASGGHPNGGGLETSAEIAERTGGALRPYCHLDFSRATRDDWRAYVERSLQACAEQGAVGLKIFKALGLGITLADGSLLAIDDPRLDIAFERAGELGLPVLIHSGDPQAFFEPPTPDNERHDELAAHPSWSFYGARENGEPWPRWREVFDQYERRVARHPGTTFLGAHFGNAPEEPETVARMLDAYPNLFVETGARIPEIGRHPPARMREIFIRHADRILFGTDFQIGGDGSLVLGSAGRHPDPPERVPAFYESHFRYFETAHRGLTHPTPIQGDWTIDGIDLPRDVLEQIYWRNAARIFDLPPPPEPDDG